MARLDAMQFTYHRIVVNSINYQGQAHLVYAYKMKNVNLTNLPSEHYLVIILKGCEYYEVESKYSNRFKNEQAVRPRQQLHTFQSFTDVPSAAFYSVEELAQYNGSDPSLPIDHPDYEFQAQTHRVFKARLVGREATHVMARTLYEPLYKLLLNDDDLCEQHRAEIENEWYGRTNPNKSY